MAKMKIQPMSDGVLVTTLSRETITKSGILLPDTSKERPEEGQVIAVGPGKMLDNGKRTTLEVKVGQKILFPKFAGTDIKLEDEEYLMLHESDVMGIIE